MRNLLMVATILAITSFTLISESHAESASLIKTSESYIQPTPDPLKAYIFTSYSFGLYDPAQSLKQDNFATTYGNNVGFGFFGTMLTGKNPFSAGGVVTASKTTLALTALSTLGLFGPSNLHPLQNIGLEYGGKFYYEHPIDMKDDPRKVMGDFIAKKIMEIYPELKQDEAIEKFHFDRLNKKTSSQPWPEALTSLSFIHEGKKYSFNIWIKDVAAADRNTNLVDIVGYNPYYETNEDSGLIFTLNEVNEDYSFKNSIFKNKELMDELLLKISSIPGLVAFQPRLKYYFYQGNMYTKQDFIKVSKKQ